MLLSKLLLVVAVLLMPIGMSGAVARQAPPAAPHGMMAMGDCPDTAPDHQRKAGIAECTMACAAALPAVESLYDEPVAVRSELNVRENAAQLHGLDPETATPPPRYS